MLIAITIAFLVTIELVAFVMLFAATAMTQRTLELDPSLEEQSAVRRGLNATTRKLSTHINIH